jgi:hypothetical protein
VLVFARLPVQDRCNSPAARGMRGIMSKLDPSITDIIVGIAVTFDPFT